MQFSEPPFSVPAPPLHELADWPTILDSAFNKILRGQKAWYSGAIVVIEAPGGGEGFDVASVYNDLVAIKTPDRATTANMTFGWQTGQLNKSFEFTEYSTFFKKGTLPVGQTIDLDLDFDDVTQKGTQVKLDVNNKPQRLTPPDSSNLAPLFDALQKVARNDVPLWFGEERAKKIRQALGVLR